MPACTLLRAHSSRRTSSDPRPSHVLCGLMKAASHGAVHDAGQPHVDRTGCHARRPLGGITGAGRRGGSSAAGFRWPSLAFRSQIYYFRSSRESEASTCIDTPCKPTKAGKVAVIIHSYCVALRGRGASRVPDKQATKASKQNAAALCAASVWHERQQAGAWSATGQCSMGSAAGAAIRMLAAHSDRRADSSA